MKKPPAFLLLLATVPACSSEPEPQDPSAVQPGYTQPTATQPGYTYTQPTATTPAPAASPAPLTAPGMSVPCQSDAFCGTHKCNLATQTCALPCGGPQDCQPGNACTMGLCLPGAAP